MFTLHATHESGARRGELKTAHGTLQTPFFMPIATKGAVKTLSPKELLQLEADVDPQTDPMVLSNTYHLFLKPGTDILEKAGGLHGLMNWPGSILTDSGGFQVFSLSNLRKLTDDGVEFSSHTDGSKHFMTPEESMRIQNAIGADIWMAFDYFPGYPSTREDAEYSVKLTTDWAKRCIAWRDENADIEKHMLFSIVQGSTFADLREQSAQELVELDTDGYAIGGLAVGEPAEEMYKAIETVEPFLPADKPRYLMGVGFPEQILEAVKRGVDMFDCVLPSRNARHGSVFVRDPRGEGRIVAPDLSEVYYQKVNIKAAKYAEDFEFIDPLDPDEAYEQPTRAYLRHLFSVGEPVASRIATIQNIRFYRQLMKEIRDAIVKA